MNPMVTFIYPLITALVTSGLIVALLKIRPERRQINAGAGKDEATTADILTGTALKMVQHAEQEAQRAIADAASARARANQAESNAADSARASIECAAEVLRMSGVIQERDRVILAYRDYVTKAGLPPLPAA
jgi:F0F1-type ATP synthase epsilon subunit